MSKPMNSCLVFTGQGHGTPPHCLVCCELYTHLVYLSVQNSHAFEKAALIKITTTTIAIKTVNHGSEYVSSASDTFLAVRRFGSTRDAIKDLRKSRE